MMEPAMLMASYAAWRMTYQDAEQAAKAAYFKAHEHAMKLDAKDAEIAALKKSQLVMGGSAATWYEEYHEYVEFYNEAQAEIASLKAKLEEAEAKAGPTMEEIETELWGMFSKDPSAANPFGTGPSAVDCAMSRLFPTAPVDEENNDDS